MEAELYLIRLLHVISGIMWIGILWYFNFVQIPSMPKIPDEKRKFYENWYNSKFEYKT